MAYTATSWHLQTGISFYSFRLWQHISNDHLFSQHVRTLEVKANPKLQFFLNLPPFNNLLSSLFLDSVVEIPAVLSGPTPPSSPQAIAKWASQLASPDGPEETKLSRSLGIFEATVRYEVLSIWNLHHTSFRLNVVFLQKILSSLVQPCLLCLVSVQKSITYV